MGVIAALLLAFAMLLLFIPVGSLVWSLLVDRSAIESAFVVMWIALGAFAIVVVGLTYRFSKNEPGWPNVGKFIGAGFGLAVIACIIAIAIAVKTNAVDSSHGGSLMVLVLGCAGVVMGGAARLLFIARRALTADSSGRHEAGAAESGR